MDYKDNNLYLEISKSMEISMDGCYINYELFNIYFNAFNMPEIVNHYVYTYIKYNILEGLVLFYLELHN